MCKITKLTVLPPNNLPLIPGKDEDIMEQLATYLYTEGHRPTEENIFPFWEKLVIQWLASNGDKGLEAVELFLKMDKEEKIKEMRQHKAFCFEEFMQMVLQIEQIRNGY